MRSIRLVSLALLSLAAACGDDGPSDTVDAPVTPDGPPDAPPLPGGCDYSELQDTTNDDVSAAGTPETTAKTLGATSITLCGQVDSTHYATSGLVDADGFAVNLPAGPIRVTVSGPGLEALRDVTLGVYSGASFGTIEGETLFRGTHTFYMDTFATGGAFEFAVIAGNAAAITAPVPYKIVITVDDPAARCSKITAAANHTEGTDTGATSNDVIDIDFSPVAGADKETLSVPTTDVVEVATGGTIGPTTNYRITGTLAETAIVGDYKDRDTFSFTTGATTDQVSIRVNWAGTADLDVYLFEGAIPSVGGSSKLGEMEDEFKTFAVKPSTTYWLWTGLYRLNTGPKPYDISICGADFTPP